MLKSKPRKSPTYRVYQHVLEHWQEIVKVSLSDLLNDDRPASRNPYGALAHLEADIGRVLEGPKTKARDTGPWNGVTS